jgi:tetratricopeptide (TPR) repeat protein
MKHLLALLALVALCGCQALSVDDLLGQAERQIVSAPDSALVTVKSIKRYALINPKHRARYGVIYSAALDKNYIDVAADSLIRFSATYYDTHGPESERMRAYYYLGRVYENAKDYQQALLYYLDAAQHPDRVDDNYLKGLLYSSLGEMYERYYNYKKAYQYAEQSYNYYKEAKLPKHQVYQLYKAGIYCANLKENDKGIKYLNQAIDLADEIGYKRIAPKVYYQLIRVYNENYEFDKSYQIIKLHKEILTNKALNEPYLYGAIGNVFTAKGLHSQADEFYNKGYAIAKNKVDSINLQYYISRALALKGRPLESLELYSHSLYNQIGYISQNIDKYTSATAVEFFNQKDRTEKDRIQKRQKRNTIATVLIVIVIVVCLIIRERRVLLRKNIQINQYMDVVNTLQKEIDSRDSKIQQITDDSLKDRCETINQLCRTYFETTHSKRQQSIIFNEVKTLVENLSSDAYLETVEKCVNQYCDNLLVQLKQDMPELSHNEYKLACFVCIGFSTQVMCLVFECTPEILYRRVYRLRDKIRHCPSEHKAKYLKYI